MDEPSTGLDPGTRRELWRYLEELRDQEGITVLLTTHLLDEAYRCDRLLLLHQGRVVAAGSPAQLKSRIGGDVVVLEAADVTALQARLDIRSTIVNGALRVEIDNGHRFIAQVIEAFPGMIHSVALHKPTLEDVFLDETGALIE